MIDLNIYPELLKCEKEKTKIDKECEKIARKEKRENGGELTLTRHLQISEPVKKYKHTIYAQAIFNIMKELNPVIIEHRTEKKLKFTAVFGDCFDKLNKDMRANIYLMVMESSQYYKLKDDIKRLNGRIYEGGKYQLKVSPGDEGHIYRNGEVVDEGYVHGKKYQEYLTIPYEDLKDYYEKWFKLTREERLKYMIKTYGKKYNDYDELIKEHGKNL